jgi:hypothetical protein
VDARAKRGLSRAFHFVGVGFALVAFYLLFAGEWGITEGIAGMVAVLPALGMRMLAHRVAHRPFTSTGIPALSLLRVPISLARDSWAVGKVLVGTLWRTSASLGHWKEQPFVQGNASEADAFRRAVVTLAVSVAPNQFVAHVPPRKEVLVVHCLADVSLKPKSRWPV